MKSVVIKSYGDNSVVEQVEVEHPIPRNGEILVKVVAAGVNPIDWKIRNGAGQRMGMTLPIYLGGEISGIVEAVGSEGSEFEVGQEVYGIIKSGGFSEYAIAKEADVVRKPRNLDHIEAAASPLGALTAWQAMFDIAKLSAGQKVLITNSSGGVGSMAVQLAKAKSAHVIAMASSRNADYVRSLGADEFVDYTSQSFEDVVTDVDVVFDAVGGDTFGRAFTVLKPGGFLVTAVAFPSDEDKRRGVVVGRVQCVPNPTELIEITDLIETGRLKPSVATVLPVEQVREALALSEAGRTRGKIVLTVSPDRRD